MGTFVVGDVVVVLFPYSDLSGHKRRPVLVLATAEFDNLILCQITSKAYSSTHAIPIANADFANGGLPIKSYVRPDKLFTAGPEIIQKTLGKLTDASLKKILLQVQKLFSID